MATVSDRGRGRTLALLAAGLACPSPARAGGHDHRPLANFARQSVSAAYRDGVLLFTYGTGDEQVRAVARWSVGAVPAGSHEYRAAQLELVDYGTLSDLAGPAPEAIPVRDREEWSELVAEVMTAVAPHGRKRRAALAIRQLATIIGVSPGDFADLMGRATAQWCRGSHLSRDDGGSRRQRSAGLLAFD